MTPLTSAAAKGMKNRLNPRRPNSWRSHIPVEPANHAIPNVGQSPPNSLAKLAAVRPSATTTIHLPYTGGRPSTSSSSARTSAIPRRPFSTSPTRLLTSAIAAMLTFMAGTR